MYQYDDSPHNTLASPPVLLSSFERDARHVCAAIFGDFFLSAAGRIEVTNFKDVTATLPFADSRSPSVMHVAGQGKYSYLVAGTERGVFGGRSRARSRASTSPRGASPRRRAAAAAAAARAGAISNVAISADGSRIACTVESQPAAPAGAKPGVGVGGAAKAACPRRGGRRQAARLPRDADARVARLPQRERAHPDVLLLGGRRPEAHRRRDAPRARAAGGHRAGGRRHRGRGRVGRPRPPPAATLAAAAAVPLEVSLFCTPEGELRLQNTFAADHEALGLLATRVPHFYFVGEPSTRRRRST